MDARLIPASELIPGPVTWFWEGRIPLGALTELIAAPGQAKSSVTYDLAARATTGRPMPACTAVSPPAHVILLQAEDHPTSTVVPSLKAAGADLTKVHLCGHLQGESQPLRFPEDFAVIEEAVADLHAKLIVLDPVASYLSGSLHSEQSVRRALVPFVALAAKHNLAVLMVRHLRKTGGRDSIHLGAGSIAFVAIVRSSLLAGNDPADDDRYRHILAVSKSNLASAPSLVYRTLQRDDAAIAIEWLGESKTAARDIALSAGSAAETSAVQEAAYVLYSLLCDGPLPASEVAHRATLARVTGRTLYRAKALLGVRSIKRGNGIGSKWFWRLPDEDRTYRAFKDHDLDHLLDQLCYGPADTDAPNAFTDFPGPPKPRRGGRDDEQFV